MSKFPGSGASPLFSESASNEGSEPKSPRSPRSPRSPKSPSADISKPESAPVSDGISKSERGDVSSPESELSVTGGIPSFSRTEAGISSFRLISPDESGSAGSGDSSETGAKSSVKLGDSFKKSARSSSSAVTPGFKIAARSASPLSPRIAEMSAFA